MSRAISRPTRFLRRNRTSSPSVVGNSAAPISAVRVSGLFALSLASLVLASCGGGGSPVVTPITYTVTVNSTNPASGVSIGVGNPLNNVVSQMSTSFKLSESSGNQIILTAPAKAGNNQFSSWTGCTVVSSLECNLTVSASVTITANYKVPAITSVTVTPNPAPVTIGATQQFSAAVAGNGSFSTGVTWSVAGPSGSTLSPGNITSSGLYTSPYPAPATVTVTATSTQDPTVQGSVTVTLSPPPAAAGPSLTVDAGQSTHPINPYIYGMNAYTLDESVAKAIDLPVARWGGDNTSRYNYKLKDTNAGSDYFYENSGGSYGVGPTGIFDDLVASDNSTGTKTLGTVPVQGWVAKDSTSCGFPTSLYPGQQSVDPTGTCGNGVYPQGTMGCTNSGGCNVTGNDPTLTSTAVGPSWAGDWVTYLVSKFGAGAFGGVAIYDLDNEPTWWDVEHRDVHPDPSTYDEVANNGLATAKAIKTADPTAEVSGPVVDFWWNYFYSKKDIESGWSSGPCYSPWDNPVDRNAHKGVPFLAYYLQQFKAYDDKYQTRLLDYLDLHTYFAATYNGASLTLTTAGDTGAQQARLNSTRVFWDPTYTDPNYPSPNYTTDPNYTSGCSPSPKPPQLIPFMQSLTAANYPGTKTAITEYNWGGQEHINGALAQADILGIFGSYGLDLGTLWGPPSPTSQVPGLMAFEIYRNYNGKHSTFGDASLSAASSNQAQLSIYAAQRTSDEAVTVVVINKTYGDLTTTVSLANYAASGSAHVYRYSNANLAAIVAGADAPITAPAKGSTTSTLSATFPAQSITLLVLPKP
jgi:hypothetical protein